MENEKCLANAEMNENKQCECLCGVPFVVERMHDKYWRLFDSNENETHKTFINTVFCLIYGNGIGIGGAAKATTVTVLMMMVAK